MKVHVFLLIVLTSIKCLYSQPISVESIRSISSCELEISSCELDFDRAQINADNSWIAVESIRDEPRSIYFFNKEDNFLKPYPLKKMKKGSLFNAFQFRWSPDDPMVYYFLHNSDDQIQFWEGQLFPTGKSTYWQINNDKSFGQFYPDVSQIPYLKIIDREGSGDIWVLGVNDIISSNYYLYISDVIFSSQDNRIFRNAFYKPYFFDIFFKDQDLNPYNNGYRVVLNIESQETDYDIIYYHSSKDLINLNNTREQYCQNCNEKINMPYGIESETICDKCHYINQWPDSEMYLFPRDVSNKPDGEQYQPRFNYDGTKIAFINSSEYVLWVFSIPSPDKDGAYFEYDEKSTSLSNYYKEIDDQIINFDKMEMPPWTGMDFCWHPEKDIIFYVKLEENKSVQEFKVKYYDFNTNQSYHLETNTIRNNMLSISKDGNYLLFTNLGINERGNTHFFNCNRVENSNENCCFKGKTFRSSVAKLKY